MWAKLMALLAASYGLAATATNEQAVAHLKSLDTATVGQLKDALVADQVDADFVASVIAGKIAPGKDKADEPATAQLRDRIITDDGDKLLAMEGKRVAQLRQLGSVLKVPDAVVEKQIAAGSNALDARTAFLKHLSDNSKPITGGAGTATIEVGVDQNIASLRLAIPDAIRIRAGGTVAQPHARVAQLRGLTMAMMYAHYLAALGMQDAFMLPPVKLVDLMSPRSLKAHDPKVAQLAQSTSDFSSILADTINKTLRASYKDAPKTWPIWAKRVTNPDFKTIRRAVLSESATPVARNQGGEIKYSTLTDGSETYNLAEYVSGIKITRQAMINDDLSAFNDIPTKQIMACARLEDDIAYAILTANAALADTGALFNATAITTTGGHANLVSSGTALSVAALAATEQLLSAQKGLKNAALLELKLKFLLVPGSKYRTAQQLLTSTVDPAKSNAAVNPFAGEGIVIVPSQRLEASSATAWYGLADFRTGQIDTIEVCFLEGEEEPVLKQETDFDTEDLKLAVRHTVAAKAIDFRGMVKNNGA